MSKYQSVDEAVKWVGEFYEALPKHYSDFFCIVNYGEPPSKAFVESSALVQETRLILKNWKTIAKNLETKLEHEIDRKIKENSGTLKRMRNFRNHENDVYGVDFNKAVIETLNELNFPLRQTKNICPSIITQNYFAGNSGINYHKSVVFNVGQPIKLMNEKTRERLGKQAQKKAR